jgi:hypothetical protein
MSAASRKGNDHARYSMRSYKKIMKEIIVLNPSLTVLRVTAELMFLGNITMHCALSARDEAGECDVTHRR